MAFSFYIYVGGYTYRSFQKTVVAKIFIWLCLSLAIWSLAYAFVYVAPDDSLLWMKISALGWCTYSAIALHTTLRFADCKPFLSPVRQAALYLPAAVFLYMSVFLFQPDAGPSEWVSDFFYIGEFLYEFIYLLLAIAILIRMARKTEGQRGRLLRNIAVAGAVPFLLNLLTQFVLPALDYHVLPPVGHLYSLIMIAGIYYANVKYRLFSIPSDILFDELMTEMMDLFFLLSPEGRIMKVNSRAESLLGYQTGELLERPLSNFLEKGTGLEFLAKGNLSAGVPSHMEVNCVKLSGELLPVRLSCSVIVDKAGELLGIVVMGQDMTITKRLEQEIRIQQETEARLRESEERFRGMFDKHTAAMCLIEPETSRILSANDAAQHFYGYTLEQFAKMTLDDLHLTTEAVQEAAAIEEGAGCGAYNRSEPFCLQHKLADGQIRDVEIHASPIHFGSRQIIFAIIHDITERKKAQDYITFLAYHDSLTGLSNRKHFYETVEAELSGLQPEDGRLALFYIDLDGFKYINDTYGHENGDYLLSEFAGRIKTYTRESDLVSRIGGDEFAVLLFNMNGLPEAQSIAEQITSSLNKPILKDGLEFLVQASIGISIYPEDGTSADTLIKAADHNMYAMKRGKKREAQQTG
jgi:diguanylate cyclase (GGDEF)-like protein/PAS domain S-box-containing protein